jgi:integrase
LVPLCKRALDLAQTAPGQKFLFLSPDNEGSGLSDNAMAAVLDRMNEDRAKAGLPRWIDPKLNRDAVPHGFRSTFKDWAIDKTDFEDYVSEAALAHARGDKAEKAYARSKVIEKRRRLMDAWASFCDGCA